MKNTISAQAFIIVLFLSGCTGPGYVAQPGDSVLVDFTCRLADGGLVETTLANIAGDEHTKKSPLFELRDTYRPIRFKIPETPGNKNAKPFAPLEHKIGVALANRVNDLAFDQTTSLTLQNEQIAEMSAAERYVDMTMEFTMPRSKVIPVKEFEQQYGLAPVIGTAIAKDSDFPGVIREISADSVTLYFSARIGAKIPLRWGGTALVQRMDEENFDAKMDVQIGQLFPRVGGVPGRITAIDAEKFTIDFGQSFAGENLNCAVTARPVAQNPGSEKPAMSWLEDLDEGLKLARQQGKPVVLLLYADQSPPCQQMLNKVLPDPSLNPFKNSFVWVKINPEKQTQYADRFGKQSDPVILVLNSVGNELGKLTGLQHVTKLAYAFDNILTQKDKAKQ